ncbi:hypothetical protein GUJ93_ZPchr0003g18475 [Zizania palustris]|uniref:DUF547 domain-containing protein n=1 Tax=Zizania palustris TaxID=103762 RepID=A0A8J5S756_ZIZPA|nr:hypothetical protein GUJ93_ZPchr0003g18475 [Zizania palustris]
MELGLDYVPVPAGRRDALLVAAPSSAPADRLLPPPQVGDLKKQLWNEQAVHQILERALLRPASNSSSSTSAGSIPAIIPPKAKQLLAELVLVEEEIARLETQILDMKQQQHKISSSHHAAVNVNGGGGGAADDANIKSMFFISQAINADFLDRHLSISTAAKAAASSTSSPKLALPPRSSIDKKQHAAAACRVDEHKKKTGLVQPNKLSERIVKCLVCIFIRLLRSSRQAELEKPATNYLQAGSGVISFRTDTTGLTKEAKQPDHLHISSGGRSGQQDHYGIFAIQDSIVRDIGPYKNLVRFTSSSFDLRGFSTSPLLTKLRGLLEALQHVDLRFLTHHQKLAFWLNIYNTCIMHGILQNGLPSNSEKLLALKNKATLNVSGQKLNALVIENFILRQPSSVKEEFWRYEVDVEEQQVRGRFGLSNSEPNILFALCCGIRSSPALRIYKADRVVMDLEKAKLEYLQASLVVTSRRRLMIPSLMHCNMHDMAKDTESLVRWICEQLPASWSLRKSMVDCLSALRGQGQGQQHSHLKIQDIVHVIPYDYEFQYLLIPM